MRAPVKKFLTALLTGAMMVSAAWAGASIAPISVMGLNDDTKLPEVTPAVPQTPLTPGAATPAAATATPDAGAPAGAASGPALVPATLPEGQVLAGAAKNSIRPRPEDYNGTWERSKEKCTTLSENGLAQLLEDPMRWAITSRPPARRGRKTPTASTWAASASAR